MVVSAGSYSGGFCRQSQWWFLQAVTVVVSAGSQVVVFAGSHGGGFCRQSQWWFLQAVTVVVSAGIHSGGFAVFAGRLFLCFS